MAASPLLIALMLAQGTPSAMTVEANRERSIVGYEELMRGDAAGAIERIESDPDLRADPAALINLGSAHARLGRMDLARDCYTAAIKSDDPYDLELSDGRWMDSRRAARLALRMLERGEGILALR